MTVKPRPLLRWFGGKWNLAPWIVSHFPPHRRYCEPFAGAASVLLRKPRVREECLNDLDGEIVNLFRVVRDEGPALVRALELSPFSRDEFVASYVPSADPVEQARRTVVRSFQGFGSNAHNSSTGFRGRSRLSGTSPASDWRNYPDALVHTVDRLRGVVIENRPALELIEAQDEPQALFYVDPPYPAGTRGTARAYRHEMTDDDHVMLAKALHQVRGAVVLSGYRCDMYDELFSGWLRVDKDTHADGARDRVESLWLSARALDTAQRRFFDDGSVS